MHPPGKHPHTWGVRSGCMQLTGCRQRRCWSRRSRLWSNHHRPPRRRASKGHLLEGYSCPCRQPGRLYSLSRLRHRKRKCGSILSCLLDLDHDRLLGCPKGERSPAGGGKYIDIPSIVHTRAVGFPPCALGYIDHAGHDTGSNTAG